jgi:nucleotide-binding universal stress UspA family protein
MQEGRYAVDVLLAEGESHDLLVIGTHGKSRAAGIVLGSTASEAAHRTERPLMIAREASLAEGFPTGILFAGDGSEGSWAPARFAAGLAARLDQSLQVVYVDDGKQPDAEAVLDDQMQEIRSVTGREPSLTRGTGAATDQIVEAAKERSSSLIVCGRRGLKGIRSLGSVSERVVHQAECSVLLVPAGE